MERRLKIIFNTITLVILIGGLAFCVWNYFAHLLYCEYCYFHYSHPLMEVVFFGIFVIAAGVFFGLSRLVLLIVKKSSKQIAK